MSQFKRFNASENQNYNSWAAYPQGTLTWDPDNGLRIHDGNTNGGNQIGGSVNWWDIQNKPSGNTALFDLIGGASSTDNGKVYTQTSMGVAEWTALPTIPADVSDLTDNNSLLPAAQVRYEMKSSSFTASAGKTYWIDSTSGTLTVTLPASPSVGDWVTLYDGEFKWQTNSLTVSGNGNTVRLVNMSGGPSGVSWLTATSTVTLNQPVYSPIGPMPNKFVWNGSVWSGAM